MGLDRQSIAGRDFPTARRGYDPAAVDAHLAAIADEVEGLVAREARAPLAASAGEQVRGILEAAEASAASIRAGAEVDARVHVERVAAATDRLRERIDALDGELTALMGQLREGAIGLRDELVELDAEAAGLRRAEPDATAIPAAVAQSRTTGDSPAAAEPPTAAAPLHAAAPPGAAARPGAAAPPEAAAPDAAAPALADADGARLVALDMALSGASREETARFLAERYALDDRDALLDEVYAAVVD